jgi:hypothetical protein
MNKMVLYYHGNKITKGETMSDRDFLAAFEEGRLDPFRHIDHIRMAWIYLATYDFERAMRSITSGIRSFAAAKNATGLYHETITLFWICMVAGAIEQTPAECFADFITRNRELTRKDYLFEFYSRELILSDAARNAWASPDLKPLAPVIDRYARSTSHELSGKKGDLPGPEYSSAGSSPQERRGSFPSHCRKL